MTEATHYNCAITDCGNKNVPAKIQRNPQGPDATMIPEGWGTITVSGMPQKSYLLCDYHHRLVSSGLLHRYSIAESNDLDTSKFKQPPLRLETDDATQAEVPALRSNEDEGREGAGAVSGS